MWDCGSARVCLCVVAGTGLSMCLSPDCWLLLATTGCVALSVLRVKRSSGFSVTVRDFLAVCVLVSSVGLMAGARITAECARVVVATERTVTLRGSICGFVQPSRTGGSVVMRAAGRRVLVRFSNLPEDLRPGDKLTVTGSLRSTLAPRNGGGYSEAAYLFQQGVWYVLEAPGYLRPSVERSDRANGIAGTYVAPVRQWIRKSVRERMSGEERAFLLALILGERGEFSEETKAAFRDSGLVHILSVSGLHTALVGLAGLILLKGAGLRGRAALAGAAVLVWFYCGLSGFQPPTVRAALMLTWMTASRLVGRSTELLGPLFASCTLLLLLSPRYFWDPGFQLSYLATASVIMSAKLARRVKRTLKVPEKVWKYLGSTVLTTCVAQLGVLPLLALQFGSVSLAAVPANLLGIPLASGGLVCGFCALALAGACPWVAGYAFDLTWLLLRLCNMVAGLASSAPHAVLELSRPRPLEVVLFLVCFFAAMGLAAEAGCIVSRGRRAALLLTVSCTAALMVRFAGVVPAWIPAGRTGGGTDRLTVDFLDVGQGDAALIRFSDGESILVDAGDTREGWDSGQRVLAPYLRAKGLRSIDAVVVSHFHSDHAGGVVWLLEKGKADRVITSGADTTSCFWKLVSRAARKHHVVLEAAARCGTLLRRGPGEPVDSRQGALIRFLWPTGNTTADTSSSSVNDSSVVCVLEHPRARIIFTGDVGAGVLDVLADALGRSPAITILKAPHHGAAATLCRRFAEIVRPDFVVFSVGHRNRFGHPSPGVVESYERTGARVFRTDEDGCVSFELREGGSARPSTANPGASHPFVRRAKRWRAERALRVLTLLSLVRGRGHVS